MSEADPKENDEMKSSLKVHTDRDGSDFNTSKQSSSFWNTNESSRNSSKEKISKTIESESPGKVVESPMWKDKEERGSRVFKLLKSQFTKLGGDIGLSVENKNTDEFVRKLEQTLMKEFKLKK